MLIGEYSYALDEKGRINFPSKFREEMGARFYVTRWLDDCCIAFPEQELERITQLLSEKSMVKSRNVARFIYSGAALVEPDKQGRILLPPVLRTHAGLDRDVVVIGVGGHAEIWSAERWQAMQDEMRSGPIASAMEEMEF